MHSCPWVEGWHLSLCDKQPVSTVEWKHISCTFEQASRCFIFSQSVVYWRKIVILTTQVSFPSASFSLARGDRRKTWIDDLLNLHFWRELKFVWVCVGLKWAVRKTTVNQRGLRSKLLGWYKRGTPKTKKLPSASWTHGSVKPKQPQHVLKQLNSFFGKIISPFFHHQKQA